MARRKFPRTFAIVLGYALFLVCMTGSRATEGVGDALAPSMAVNVARLATSAACIGLGIASLARYRFVNKLVSWGFVLCTCAGLVCWLVGVSSSAVVSVVMGLGIGCGYLTWAHHFARIDPDRFIIDMVLIRLGWGLVGIPVSFFNTTLERGVVLLPILAVDALLLFVAARTEPVDERPGADTEKTCSFVARCKDTLLLAVPSLWKIMLLTCVLAATSGVLRTFVATAGVTGIWLGFERFGCAVVGAFVLLLYERNRGAYANGNLLFAMIAIAAGVYTVLPVIRPEYRIALHLVSDSIYISGCMLMSVACAFVAQEDRRSSMAVFGVCQGIVNLAITLGSLLTTGVIAGEQSTALDTATVSLFAVYAIVVVLVVVIIVRRKAGDPRGDEPVIRMAVTISENAVRNSHALTEGYGISKREMDVLVLALTGRSAAAIAECLYLSEGTVKTHLKHIYKKLDIHTKDELRTLVEQVVDMEAER